MERESIFRVFFLKIKRWKSEKSLETRDNPMNRVFPKVNAVSIFEQGRVLRKMSILLLLFFSQNEILEVGKGSGDQRQSPQN